MLYVFQVDTGMMMTFDMTLAMNTVANLKKAIARKTDVPEDKQVLLISGGESLSSLQRVCSYSSAGTDTSPIFLFAKVNIESNQPPMPNVDYGDDTDMTEMIESCMSMQPSLDTLVARTELSADLNDQAIKQKEVCEKLVHDQHLQQQGWAAVTANLEDLTRAFRIKAELLMAEFSEFTKCKPSHKELLNKFGDDIKSLDSIPILPALNESNKIVANNSPIVISNANSSSGTSPHATSNSDVNQSDDQSKTTNPQTPTPTQELEATTNKDAIKEEVKKEEEEASKEDGEDSEKEDAKTPTKESAQEQSQIVSETETKSQSQSRAGFQTETQSKSQSSTQSKPQGKSSTKKKNSRSNLFDEPLVTLRQWIDYHDSYNSLERLIEMCWRGLERFTEANADQIRLEVQELLKSANNTSMKEIKGLEERLFGLEKLMVDAKKVVDEQSQLASSFQNNRERFSKIKDSTLLPDLSASHKQQLQMMLTNHKKMSDYRNRCIKAKHELSINLHARLKWIMYIEQQISDLDGKMMVYKDNLLRLNRHFEIVDQVHKSPELYLEAVMEAMRRRRFSRRYLHWASSIARISQELYEGEMEARKTFDTKLGTHFLSNMFPGLTKSYPPRFATNQPDPFDTELPRITAVDIQFLQLNLKPELGEKLTIPEDAPMPHLISGPFDESVQLIDTEEVEDEDDRQSLNPTPPSSPQRQQQTDD